MAEIQVLDQNTINQIAAGEVIERPASVIKELLENAIDAKATAVTVEIRDGGLSMIRVTDNGKGIPKEEIPLAFLRHATSKIRTAEDLITVSSLGFRGEALSSIASVAQVELITKPQEEMSGCRYCIEGGEEKCLEEVGAPVGTTFLVRNLFYNTPARRKFLKTPSTEGAHVAALIEKIALSHPEISIRFIQNNQNKLHTTGNRNLKDIIYTVFGREITANLLPIASGADPVRVEGYIGKPVIARGNRNYENYFINGRYIKSSLINKAIEEAFKPFMMQHKYPFTMLQFTIDPSFLDVNVHPAKMELRFRDGEMIYRMVYHTISMALSKRELIPEVVAEEQPEAETGRVLKPVHAQPPRPEPFETRRREIICDPVPAYGKPAESQGTLRAEDTASASEPSVLRPVLPPVKAAASSSHPEIPETVPEKMQTAQGQPDLPVLPQETAEQVQPEETEKPEQSHQAKVQEKPRQMDLFEDRLLTKPARSEHRLIGQVFDTYWLIQYHDKLYIIDQHAAHEKVLYERTMASMEKREFTSQVVNPPIILTLNDNEQLMLERYMDHFTSIGFEIEPFGGREFAVRAVPANLFSIAKKDLLMEMIDDLADGVDTGTPESINSRIATMSCKAAVKGGNRLSEAEAGALIDELLELKNPYACPHGRPTIITVSRYELEKKFKRIV